MCIMLLLLVFLLVISLSVSDINDCCHYLSYNDNDRSSMMSCIVDETIIQNRKIFDNKVPYSRGYQGPSYHIGHY